VARTFTKIFAAVVAGTASATAAWAQAPELKPLELPAYPDVPAMYRSDGYDVRDRQKLREQARKTYWTEEAERIARSGRNVVRDNEELYIYLDVPGVPHAVVLRNLWTIDPAARYSYLGYDDVGRFHILSVGGSDYPTLLFVSAKTGMIYEGTGTHDPVYSPDKSRFFSAGLGGMGCGGEGFTVYRFAVDKVLLEAQSRMSCEGPCTHSWSGSSEIRSVCTPSDRARIEYRLTYNDGKWHGSRSP
jgi:hypothetical protein